MPTADVIATLQTFFTEEPAVVFAYLFGSAATGKAGPLSDIDVAVFLTADTDTFDFRIEAIERLGKALRTDNVDLVSLKEAPPVLKHAVIRDGVVVKENHPARVRFEVAATREYLDTARLRQVFKEGTRKRLQEGRYLGR